MSIARRRRVGEGSRAGGAGYFDGLWTLRGIVEDLNGAAARPTPRRGHKGYFNDASRARIEDAHTGSSRREIGTGRHEIRNRQPHRILVGYRERFLSHVAGCDRAE